MSLVSNESSYLKYFNVYELLNETFSYLEDDKLTLFKLVLLPAKALNDLQFCKFLSEDINSSKPLFDYVSYCQKLDTLQVANALFILLKNKIIRVQSQENTKSVIVKILATTQEIFQLILKNSLRLIELPRRKIITIVEKQTFEFVGIDISFWEEVFLGSFHFLSQTAKLKSLVLKISYVAVNLLIVSKIINVTNLQKLEISDLKISASLLKEIFTSKGKNLKSVNVKYLICSESIQTIAENCPNFQEIIIHYGGRSVFCLEKFIPIFQNCQHLLTFNFSNWSVEALEKDLQPLNTFVKIFLHFSDCLLKLVIHSPFYKKDIIEFFVQPNLV
ncbi:32939_t:CDS:2 [Gigaspora margarita]|uniref:32939_t:CDS:1 n=1 Tax=Gigaspora margarita TaxID=4874 RepID=A0ABN7UII4_GIGMA|nr:32939_t:CDS:2 [Gigaspora margarita]